jgi:tripartite-type tricarboxylate transporter receptor subunit TctC
LNRRDVLALLGAAVMPRLAQAQPSYPQGPIKLVVPYSAGGIADVIGRQLAERLKRPLGNVSVENKRSGDSDRVLDVTFSAPDGHTLVLGDTYIMVLNPMTMRTLPYDPVRDLIPIAILCVGATAVVVNAALPVKTLKELIAYAKANPLAYGSGGTTTMSNLAVEMFKQLTGTTDIIAISYRRGISDLVSGEFQLMMPIVNRQVLELHKTGKVRILAVNASERLKAAPEIPTAIEEGLPGMIGMTFYSIAAPAATPRPIFDKIAEATQIAMADPDFQKVLLAAGLDAIPNSNPDHAGKFLQDERDRWLPVTTNLKTD